MAGRKSQRQQKQKQQDFEGDDSQQRETEMDMDEMQMAIAALSSLKESTAASNGHESSTSQANTPRDALTKPPAGIAIPPISTSFNNTPRDNHDHQHYHGIRNGYPGPSTSKAGGLQYSYVSADPGQGNGAHDGYAYNNNTHHPDSSASTSTYTHSPVTTPSVRTTTSLSSPGSPELYERSPFFGHDGTQGSLIASSSSPRTVHPANIPTELNEDGFIGRVSQLPLVSGALRVYERGRNSSRVVKYSTDLVESSVKTLSKPVIDRVVGPSLVGQIDDFACRQLDRFGTRPSQSPNGGLPSPLPDQPQFEDERERYRLEGEDETEQLSVINSVFDDASDSVTDSGAGKHTNLVHSTASRQTDPEVSASINGPSRSSLVRADTGSRSRWQSLVIEAGVTAGGIGAAVSEESMKSLKYCLHWLHYATAHLDHQAGILREFILSLSSQRTSSAIIRGEDARAASILDGIKRDVVETIRKVVDVVSTYAGAALPEQARRYVRSSILGLPEKWSRAMQGQQTIEVSHENALSSEGPANIEATNLEDGVTQRAAERTLTFAVESLDMLRGLLGIFNDSVERADAWVERLRLVGLQRQYGREETPVSGAQSTLPAEIFLGDNDDEARLAKVSGSRARVHVNDGHISRRRHADDDTANSDRDKTGRRDDVVGNGMDIDSME